MAPESGNVFSSMQQDILYEGCINEARAYLDGGDFDKAIASAERAREYLRPEKGSSEVDAIISSARDAMSRAENDRRELAEREEQERRRLAEQERLAREQEEQRKRQAAQEEQSRKRQQAEESKKVRNGLYTFSWVAFALYTAFLAYLFFIAQKPDINIGLTNAVYIVIIAVWSLLGGMAGYGIAAPMIPALIVYGGLYASVAGSFIANNYLYYGMADGYGQFIINLLGWNDFIVIKYIGLTLVVCAIVVLMFGAIGKAMRTSN